MDDARRYARQTSLPEIGERGQRAISSARILVVGVGGLGSPAATYLAAAGIGTIGLADPDSVEISNLNRQTLHGEGMMGKPKTLSAESRLKDLNPDIRLVLHQERLDDNNARNIIGNYDIILDCTDNISARYTLNKACQECGKPLIHGAIKDWEGRLAIFHPGGPCYSCLFPSPEPASNIPNGVIGVVPGVIGSLQALQAIRMVLGADNLMRGVYMAFDGMKNGFHEYRYSRDSSCPVCRGTKGGKRGG